MFQRLRPLLVTLSVAGICALVLVLQRPEAATSEVVSQLKAAEGLTWYRGNIHTHSLWSDGDDYPEMIGLWYREHGYDFLCYTDHNVLPQIEKWIDVEKSKGGMKAYEKLVRKFPKNWVEQRMNNGRLEVQLKKFPEVAAEIGIPDEFLLIQGEEVTDRFGNLPVHMNATNVTGDVFPPMGGESVYDVMQNNVNAVVARRERTGEPTLIHLNHPNFRWGVTAEDLMRVRGENFFEVYNGHPGVNNRGDETHAGTERIWDIVLTMRLTELDLPLMYGLATDDGHSYHNIPSRSSEPGRGWVVVLADSLNPAALIAALEHGRFYASSGVALKSITHTRESLQVEVEAQPETEYTVEFIGTRRGFDAESEPVKDKDGNPLPVTRKYSDDIGEVLKTVEGSSAAYAFQGDELYVRARVTSSRKHPNPSAPGDPEQAWVQPVHGPASRP
ncbi:MAG: hypothetical protein KDA79_02780 [Planctomycetaceae bacterium]|nr:hypothetical protein [Planctomycetaceae bacterium]